MARISILIALLLVAPVSAAADLAPLSTSETLPVAPEGLPDPNNLDVPGIIDTAKETVDDVVAGIECSTAVAVDLVWWTGVATDHQDVATQFVANVGLTEERIIDWLPVYQTEVETLVSSVLGLLPVEPVTREITRLVGFDPVTEVVTLANDLAVHVSWEETYIDWTEQTETIYLTLPAGLPMVATGEGTIVNVCNLEETLENGLPELCNTGTYCSVLPKSDGWYMRLLSCDVAIATPEDKENLVERELQGIMIAGNDIAERVEEQARRDGLLEEVLDEGELALLDAVEPQQPSVAADGEVVDETVVVPPSTAGIGAAMLAALASVGAGFVAFVRKP